MRTTAYWLAELVAWPAAVWGGIELALRGVTGYGAGASSLVVMTACAALTIGVARARCRMLVTA